MKTNPIRAMIVCITQTGDKIPRKLQKKHCENCGVLETPLQLALQDVQALAGGPLCKHLDLQVLSHLGHRRTALSMVPRSHISSSPKDLLQLSPMGFWCRQCRSEGRMLVLHLSGSILTLPPTGDPLQASILPLSLLLCGL